MASNMMPWSGFAQGLIVCGLAGTASGSTGAPFPMRGIAYGALPCTTPHCGDVGGWVSEDMVQEAYAPQWGAAGRDDLGIMASMNANTVRLYHSLGLEMTQDHGGFLDHAQEVGLNVMPGYHSYASCPQFDCYETWKQATLEGFRFGYKRGNGWHPAISALILLNEPDFFGNATERVRLALSALDGVLAAEREAGIAAGHVRLSITWSFGMRKSVDGKVVGPGTFGFQDMVAGVANPGLAHYTLRSSLAEFEHAFRTRWIHGVNVQAPWGFVKPVIHSGFAKQFGSSIPWFIGEYGANGQDAGVIQKDLEDMQRVASEDPTFLGAAFFQFQTAYFKTGSELNFGMFSLGREKFGDIIAPVNARCPYCKKTWPVYCLSTRLDWLPGSMAGRAQAVADAWKGEIKQTSAFCKGRRLAETVGDSILV